MGKNYKKNDVFNVFAAVATLCGAMGLSWNAALSAGERLDDLFRGLPKALKYEIRAMKTGTNVLDVMSYTLSQFRGINQSPANVRFIDGANHFITAHRKLTYASLEDSHKKGEIPLEGEHGVAEVLEVFHNAKEGFVLRGSIGNGNSRYYVFSTSKTNGPRLEDVLTFNNDVHILFGDTRFKNYFYFDLEQAECSVMQHGALTWKKDAFKFLSEEGARDVDSLSCNNDLSRVAMYASYHDGSTTFYIIDGLCGKLIKTHSCRTGDDNEILTCVIARESKEYVVVRKNGEIEYCNESGECYKKNRIGALGAQWNYGEWNGKISPDLSRIIWDPAQDDRSPGIHKKLMLFKDGDKESSIIGRFRFGERYQSCGYDVTLEKIYYYPHSSRAGLMLGDLDTLALKLTPENADFLSSFKMAINIARAERARIDREIKIHQSNPKNRDRGYVYFPSAARVIILKDSLLYKKFTRLPAPLQKMLQYYARDLFRIYPDDHPKDYLEEIDPTRPPYEHISKVMHAMRLLQEKETSNKRKHIAWC